MTETKFRHAGDLFPALTVNLPAGLRFPVGHSADADAIGRLVPQDVVGLVRYLREHAPASQSR